jgi:hypothetical protein
LGLLPEAPGGFFRHSSDISSGSGLYLLALRDRSNGYKRASTVDVRNIVKAREETRRGRFARTGMTNNSDRFAGPRVEGHIFQHPIFVLVGEPDIPEFDFTFRRPLRPDRIGGIDDCCRRVDQSEQSFGAGHSRLKDVVFLTHVGDGLREC